MRGYTVRIKEALEEFVTIEALSAEEAKDKVQAAWENSDYILDAEHFQGVILLSRVEGKDFCSGMLMPVVKKYKS